MSVRTTEWLPLTPNGDLSKWWIEPFSGLKVEGDTLVISETDVRAEVGGMSWDDYELSSEIMINPTGEGAYCQLELTAAGTCAYCQLIPGWVVLAYFSHERNGTAHIGKAPLKVSHGTWHEFLMRAEGGMITAVFDGKELTRGHCPNGTKGMPGFLAKFLKNTEARMRNIKIRFLAPTPEQLEEYELDATTNWQNYEARRRATQQRLTPGD
jgi:hypothetical protein